MEEDIKMGRKTLETVLRESGLVEDWEAQVEARITPRLEAQIEARVEAQLKAQVEAWVEARGEQRGLEKTAKNALEEGASLEFVQKITGLDMETIRALSH
jgi:hypothetical protein